MKIDTQYSKNDSISIADFFFFFRKRKERKGERALCEEKRKRRMSRRMRKWRRMRRWWRIREDLVQGIVEEDFRVLLSELKIVS